MAAGSMAVLLWCITGSCQKGVMLITRKALKKCLLHVHVFTVRSMAASWSQGSPAVPVWEPVCRAHRTLIYFSVYNSDTGGILTQALITLVNCNKRKSGLVILQIAVFMYGRKGLGIHSRWRLNSLQRVDVAYGHEKEWKEETKVSIL